MAGASSNSTAATTALSRLCITTPRSRGLSALRPGWPGHGEDDEADILVGGSSYWATTSMARHVSAYGVRSASPSPSYSPSPSSRSAYGYDLVTCDSLRADLTPDSTQLISRQYVWLACLQAEGAGVAGEEEGGDGEAGDATKQRPEVTALTIAQELRSRDAAAQICPHVRLDYPQPARDILAAYHEMEELCREGSAEWGWEERGKRRKERGSEGEAKMVVKEAGEEEEEEEVGVPSSSGGGSSSNSGSGSNSLPQTSSALLGAAGALNTSAWPLAAATPVSSCMVSVFDCILLGDTWCVEQKGDGKGNVSGSRQWEMTVRDDSGRRQWETAMRIGTGVQPETVTEGIGKRMLVLGTET